MGSLKTANRKKYYVRYENGNSCLVLLIQYPSTGTQIRKYANTQIRKYANDFKTAYIYANAWVVCVLVYTPGYL